MTRDQAIAVLGQVIDPEVGLDIVEMGLVYDVRIDPVDAAMVEVTMTLTTPGCPLHDVMVEGVERALLRAGAGWVDVNVVFDPPWTPDRIGASGP